MRPPTQKPRPVLRRMIPFAILGAIMLVYAISSLGLAPNGLSTSVAQSPPKADITTKKGNPKETKTIKDPEQAVFDDLRQCTTFDCLRKIRSRLPAGTFNMPHFMIIGWQKCATTSLYWYLQQHPQVTKPLYKEPHFFSVCRWGGKMCKSFGNVSEAGYIRDTLQVDLAASSRLQLATLDSSADYAQYGKEVAQLIYDQFPWVKIVIGMREPISRAISWKTMMAEKLDKGCNQPKLKDCLQNVLDSRKYAEPLQGWLEVFPRDQIQIVQFEELVKDPTNVLNRVKLFLNLDPEYPKSTIEQVFENVNGRNVPGTKGWNLTEAGYKELVEIERADALKVAALISKYKVGNAQQWMNNWEEVWQSNLATCVNGVCDVHAGLAPSPVAVADDDAVEMTDTN